VGHAWIVDPVERSLEVCRLMAERFWLLICAYQGKVTVGADPFDAIELDFGAPWVPDPTKR
jgi:hypothetical protein